MIQVVRNLVAEKDVVKKKQKHVEQVVKKIAVRKNQNKKILKGVFNE